MWDGGMYIITIPPRPRSRFVTYQMPGYHAPGYNFLGPGTPYNEEYVRTHSPRNTLDAIAMQHDFAYVQAERNALSMAELNMLEEKADFIFVSHVDEYINGPHATLGERFYGSVALHTFYLKQLAGYRMLGADEDTVARFTVDWLNTEQQMLSDPDSIEEIREIERNNNEVVAARVSRVLGRRQREDPLDVNPRPYAFQRGLDGDDDPDEEVVMGIWKGNVDPYSEEHGDEFFIINGRKWVVRDRIHNAPKMILIKS